MWGGKASPYGGFPPETKFSLPASPAWSCRAVFANVSSGRSQGWGGGGVQGQFNATVLLLNSHLSLLSISTFNLQLFGLGSTSTAGSTAHCNSFKQPGLCIAHIAMFIPFHPGHQSDLCCAFHSFATKPDARLFSFLLKDLRLPNCIIVTYHTTPTEHWCTTQHHLQCTTQHQQNTSVPHNTNMYTEHQACLACHDLKAGFAHFARLCCIGISSSSVTCFGPN